MMMMKRKEEGEELLTLEQNNEHLQSRSFVPLGILSMVI
jgi:hypothetical protein